MNNDDLYDNYTPWDRLVNLEARIEMLERNLHEVVQGINIHHQHLQEINNSIMMLQKHILEIKAWQNQQ